MDGATSAATTGRNEASSTNEPPAEDADLLMKHAAREAASLRATVLHEVRRSSRDDGRALCKPDQLDQLSRVIDDVLRLQLDGLVAFYLLLLQHAFAASPMPAPVNRGAIADRAALLRVRQALEMQQSTPKQMTASVATSTSPPIEPTKARTASSVRWALSDHDDHGQRDKPSNSLCMHAFEALRESVQALEDKQPQDFLASTEGGTGCDARAAQTSWRDVDMVGRRGHAAAPMLSPALDGAGSDSETNGTMAAEPCSPAGAAGAGAVCRDTDATRATDESDEGRISPQGVTWCSTRKTNDGSVQLINCSPPTIRPCPQPSRSSFKPNGTRRSASGSLGGGSSGWEVVRSAFNIRTSEPARGTSGASINRCATIRRMITEPGAEESDYRQLQMLRNRSSSCVIGRKNTRRVAPAESKERPPIFRRTSVVKTPMDAANFEPTESPRPSSPGVSQCISHQSGRTYHSKSPAPSDDLWEQVCTRKRETAPPTRLSLLIARRNRIGSRDASEACSCLRTEAKESMPAPLFSSSTPAVVSATDGPSKSSGVGAASRRGSLVDSAVRRVSVDVLFARNRRGSMGDGRSRRESIGNGRASRRPSSLASRRGSLTDMYTSLQSSPVGGAASLAAAAAFLLSDVSAEPGLQEIRPYRTRGRHTSSASGITASAEPASAHNMAAVRASFLGAMSGNAQAACTLRGSLMRRVSLDQQTNCCTGAASSTAGCQPEAASTEPASGLGALLQTRRRSSTCASVISAALPSQCLVSSTPRRGSVSAAPRRCSVAPNLDTNMRATPSSLLPGAGGGITNAPHLQDSACGRTTISAEAAETPPGSCTLVRGRTALEDGADGYLKQPAWLVRGCMCQCICASYERLPLVVLHPLSRLRLYWDALVALVALWCLIEVPLRIVFAPYNRFGYMPGSSSINYAVIVTFIIQPLVEIRTLVVLRGAPEERPGAIFCHYLHSWKMPLDIISACCPLLELVWPPLALCCVIRLIYVIRVVHKLEKATKTSPSLIRSIQMMLGAVPALHWFACIFCYLALSPDSWLENYEPMRGEKLKTSDARIYLYASAFGSELRTFCPRVTCPYPIRHRREFRCY